MINRETAWRIFASELNGSSFSSKGEEEMSPFYVITKLGAVVNRVLIAGVLTEKENIGNEEEPLWRGRIQDVNGSFFINVGKFQPEAASAIADLEVPSFVAIVGKVRTYTTDDSRVFVSVRPETIVQVDEDVRNQWILSAAKSLWERLIKMKKAMAVNSTSKKDLIDAGFSEDEVEGIDLALNNYGVPTSSYYVKTIQDALRMLLPDSSIDFGFPEDVGPDEIDIDPEQTVAGRQDMEDAVLRIITELDTDGKGAPRDEVERSAEAEGISATELEEISDALMDKGMVYEPDLKRLKHIPY
ncbi:MAG TPA: glycerol dehydrogenase [Candidatus Methanomethylophilaceae archaeon]|nr:glycerol dehydrogenase [Candidatus Methanomethylophilaceae archaeon]